MVPVVSDFMCENGKTAFIIIAVFRAFLDISFTLLVGEHE
jgi:hypothetical protein